MVSCGESVEGLRSDRSRLLAREVWDCEPTSEADMFIEGFGFIPYFTSCSPFSFEFGARVPVSIC